VNVRCLPVGLLQVNCYLVFSPDSRECVVIDPGDESPLILDAIGEEGVTVKEILLTHGHADHVGGVRGLVEALGVPLRMHEADRPMLDTAVEHGRMFGLEIAPPPPPDGYLEEGDIVTFGGESLRVLHTPGHSPGGICFLGGGAIFVGDTLFASSIGRFDLPGGSYDTLMESISRKILPLEDSTVVYPGHGPSTTVGAERASNPFLV